MKEEKNALEKEKNATIVSPIAVHKYMRVQ